MKLGVYVVNAHVVGSLSVRRAWIEISFDTNGEIDQHVALREESVD